MRLTLLVALLFSSLFSIAQDYYLFVGTYTARNSGSKGIYVYRFHAATGEMDLVSTAAAEDPSYLTLAPGGRYLYSVNETHEGNSGGVSAFSFNKGTGQLKFINKQKSGGADPCYITVDAHRKWAFVANYSGGSLAALPIKADGSLGAITQFIQHTGTGPNAQRQDKPHVHSTILSPDERFLVVADLGLDQLSVYHFNTEAPTLPLSASPDSIVTITPGSGPRHTSFSPRRPYVYLLNEMSGTVDAFHYSEGKLLPLQHISSHPEGYTGSIGSADIHVGPGEKYLYASNRGDANSIATYAIDPANGKLSIKGFQSTLGKTPRNFIVDPSGRWLLVANQGSNNIVIFSIDPNTGLPKPTGKQVQVPAPVCLKLLPAK